MCIPYGTLSDIRDELRNIREILGKQSTIEVSERTGEWIKLDEHKHECPFCHVHFGNFGLNMNYCPNCGKRMRG